MEASARPPSALEATLGGSRVQPASADLSSVALLAVSLLLPPLLPGMVAGVTGGVKAAAVKEEEDPTPAGEERPELAASLVVASLGAAEAERRSLEEDKTRYIRIGVRIYNHNPS